MSSLLSRVSAIVVALILLFFASTYYIGLRVSNEVELLGEALIERDDVRVTRLDYDAGFFTGTVHYDFVWRPLHEDPIYSALEELGLTSIQGLVLRGELPVRHGPWVGQGHGFALAGTATDFALPDEMREFLPQYPGQKPAMSMSSALSLGGMINTHVSLVDYKGRVLDADSTEQLQLETQGVLAKLGVSTNLDDVLMDIRIPLLSLKVTESGTSNGLILKKMTYNQRARAERPLVWVGNGELGIEDILIQSDKDEFKLEKFSLKALSEIKKGFLDNEISFKLGPMTAKVDNQQLAMRGLELTTSLRHVDLDAYAQIALLLQDGVGVTEEFSFAQLDQLMASLMQILNNQPVLAVDKLSLSITGKDDVLTNLTMTYQGGKDLDLAASDDALLDILRALGLEMGAELSISALQDLMAFYLHANNDAEMTEAEIRAAAKSAIDERLQELRALPYVKVTDKTISAQLTLSDGNLLVNGESVMTVEDIAALASLAMMDFDFDGADDYGLNDEFGQYEDYSEEQFADLYDTGDLNLNAAPLYEYAVLQTDFYPDPYAIDLVAGGETNLVTALDPQCLGFVNGEQPDVILNFSPGQYALSIYVDAGGADTTLAIHAPDGYWYCDDDYPEMGLDPAIYFESPLSGDYVIWVGTHDASNISARLLISERGVGVQ